MTSWSFTSASRLKAKPQRVVQVRVGEQGRLGRHAREGGLGDDQAVEPLRVIGGQGVGDRHTDVGAVHGEPLVAERLHQRDHAAKCFQVKCAEM